MIIPKAIIGMCVLHPVVVVIHYPAFAESASLQIH